MALTISDLVDEANDTWRSYVRIQEQVTALSGSLSDSALTFVVDDATKVSTGLIQIGDEMMQVKSLDRTTNTITLEAWGRAQMGSTASSHSSGAKVTTAPIYPRVRVLAVVSEVVQEIFPQLFAVTSTTLDVTAAQVNYDLPVDTYQVLSVAQQPPGPSLSWVPVTRWRQNRTPTTVELEIFSAVTPGADRVRVFYIKTPPSQLTMSDDLEDMGYPASVKGVIIAGVAQRLAAFTEASRVQVASVESHARSEAVPAGSSAQLSKFLYQLYRERLTSEARDLQIRYPAQMHFTR